MNPDHLQKLLEKVKAGEITVAQAIENLRQLPFEDLGFAKVDHHRKLRRGFPEVIYCPGKTDQQIIEIFSNLAERGNNVLGTRATEDVFNKLTETKKFPNAQYNKSARTIVLRQKKLPPSKSVIPIVTAGTSDLPVAEEARVTAETMGQQAEIISDVGVAGLHRVLKQLDKLQKANVIIVVAGMEGALAGVVGGLVSCPVIGVPTSVGYGTALNGFAALLTMLNSCASGVTVVNIDNGFSAAVTASMINKKIEADR